MPPAFKRVTDCPIHSLEAGGATVENIDELSVVTTLFRGSIRQLAFAPDGRILSLSGFGIDILDPDTLEPVSQLLEGVHVGSIGVIREDLLLVVHTDGKQAIHRVALDGELGAPVVETEYHQPLNIVAHTQYLGVPHQTGVTLYDWDGNEIRTFEMSDELIEEARRKPWVRDALISPDGSIVVANSSGTALAAWNVETGETLLTLTSFDVPDELFFLDDGRLVASSHGSGAVYDFENLEAPMSIHLNHRGSLVYGEGHLLCVDGFGAYNSVSVEDFSEGPRVEAPATHYGSVPGDAIASVSADSLVCYAASYGQLRHHRDGETVSADGYLTGLKMLSVSADGARLVLESEWRGEALAIDLEAGTTRVVADSDGIVAPAVTGDGSTIVFGAGMNINPRVIHTAPFDGSEPPTAGQKILAWARRTQGFGNNLYAVNTYKLGGGGYLGVYRLGDTNALMKIKEGDDDALAFEINREGTRALIRWRGHISLHDLESKGKELKRFGAARAMAMGHGEILAHLVDQKDAPYELRIQGESGEIVVDCEMGSFGLGQPCIAFNDDDSLIFVGKPTGEVEVFRTADGTSIKRLCLHAGAIHRMTLGGGLVWSVGDDGFVHALGIPGADATKTRISSPEIADGEVQMAPTAPWKPRREEVVEIPENPDATSVEPFPTDWAITQNPTIVSNLEAEGFVRNSDSAHAIFAMELYAPELGIAVVALDEEHGCTQLSFHRWDGTLEGGGLMTLGEVDPLFYSEAFLAVRDAYSV